MMVLPNQPQLFFFADDGQFPNNYLPVLLYQAIIASDEEPLDDWFEKKLTANHWGNNWRNGILSYHHYHSTSHEVLCIYAGWGEVLLGGPGGKMVRLQVGDMVIIPAGVAHKNVSASADFAVLGGYPEGRTWDLLTGESGERPAADESIRRLPVPAHDPLYGSSGPLVNLWLEFERNAQ